MTSHLLNNDDRAATPNAGTSLPRPARSDRGPTRGATAQKQRTGAKVPKRTGEDRRSSRRSGAVIVIPCYNESARLSVGRFRRFAHANPTVTFLFVDDGSQDSTGLILRELRSSDPHAFKVISLPVHRGKGEAVRQAMLAALPLVPSYIGYWDADLATPLDEINGFMAIMNSRPSISVVIGSRMRLLGHSVSRSLARHWASRCFATIASLLVGIRAYDPQCGAKLFRVSPAVRNAVSVPFVSRWGFDLEMLARIKECGAAGNVRLWANVCYEAPLDEWREVRGSKFTVSAAMRTALELLRIAIRYRRRRARRT